MIFSSGFYLLSGNHQKSLKTIVKETKVQIDNLKKNFDDEKGKLLHIENKYLKHLNLYFPGNFYPNATWLNYGNASDPVLVSSVMTGQAGDAIHFVRNAQMFMPNSTIILYDLGISQHEFQLVLQYCNSSELTRL